MHKSKCTIIWLLTNAYAYVMEKISRDVTESSLISLPRKFHLPSPQRQSVLWSFHHSWLSLVLSHINGSVPYISFWVSLFFFFVDNVFKIHLYYCIHYSCLYLQVLSSSTNTLKYLDSSLTENWYFSSVRLYE